jgi:hypothetical protein
VIGLGRAYAVEFHAVSVSAQQDFFYVKPAADKICVIEALYLGVAGVAADAGDAQEELLDIRLAYVPATVTAGSGGGAMTPNSLSVNDTAASFTARINDTTKATSSGTIVWRHSDTMNSRVPYVYIPPPEHRAILANAAAMTVQLNSTPTDALLMNGTLIVRELP